MAHQVLKLLQQKPHSWILFNKYLQLVTFEIDDNYSIRYDSKWKKNTIRTALITSKEFNTIFHGES